MIDLEKCKKLFKDYVNNYDMSNDKINLKYYHTLRVTNFCREIAESLNLSNDDIEISELIGLLHDIGRFEQIRVYNTFIDKNSIDHADYGFDILKTNNFIEQFVSDNEIQNIVLIAIRNHNKFSIENGLDERINLFCKIIRDADKLDIFDVFIKTENYIQHTDTFMSKKVLETLLSQSVIKDIDMQTEMDYYLRQVGMLYDLNFPYSLNYIKKNNIVNKLVDRIINQNSHERDNLNHVKQKIYKFIENNNGYRKEE